MSAQSWGGHPDASRPGRCNGVREGVIGGAPWVTLSRIKGGTSR
jgi:hypothetical protein